MIQIMRINENYPFMQAPIIARLRMLLIKSP